MPGEIKDYSLWKNDLEALKLIASGGSASFTPNYSINYAGQGLVWFYFHPTQRGEDEYGVFWGKHLCVMPVPPGKGASLHLMY